MSNYNNTTDIDTTDIDTDLLEDLIEIADAISDLQEDS